MATKTVSLSILYEIVRYSCNFTTNVDTKPQLTTCKSSSDHSSHCDGPGAMDDSHANLSDLTPIQEIDSILNQT